MDQDYNNQMGIKNGNLGDPATRGLVEMNVDALHTVGDPDWVAFIRGTVLQANDSFTWVKNRHNLKFGGVDHACQEHVGRHARRNQPARQL